MASLFKRKWTTNGVQRESKHWYAQIVVEGKARRFKLFTDQKASEVKLGELLKRAERGAAGLTDPFEEHLQRPTSAHLDEYIIDLESAKRDSMYTYNIEKRMTILIEGCGWQKLADVKGESFSAWRYAKLQDEKRPSDKTLNDYLATARAFCNWAVAGRRMEVNPLATVDPIEKPEEAAPRRALSAEEIGRLLAVAGRRKVVYLVAILYGLRRAEIASVRWADMRLDTIKPFFTVRGGCTKNGKPVTCILRDDVLAELRTLPVGADDALIFDDLLPSMEVFRADLRAAGIEEKDKQGRVVVFHSLRHCTATLMAQAGVAPRVAQEYMRHSDRKLTEKVYTDASLLPTAAVVEDMPRWGISEPNVAKATGTYDVAATPTDAVGTQTVGGALTQKVMVSATRYNPVRVDLSAIRHDDPSKGSGENANVNAGLVTNDRNTTLAADGVESWGTRIRT